MASTSPRAEREAEAEPGAVLVSPSRWNGWKTRSRSAGGIPGPWSTTCSSTTRRRRGVARTTGGWPGGENRWALATRLTITRSSSPGSATTSGSSSSTSSRTARGSTPEVVERAGHDVLDGDRARCGPAARPLAAGSCPAGCRPGRRAGRAHRRRSRAAPGGRSSRARRPRLAARRRRPSRSASGVRRSWPTAASSAVRSRSAGLDLGGRRAPPRRAVPRGRRPSSPSRATSTKTHRRRRRCWHRGSRKVWKGGVKKKFSRHRAEPRRRPGRAPGRRRVAVATTSSR